VNTLVGPDTRMRHMLKLCYVNCNLGACMTPMLAVC